MTEKVWDWKIDFGGVGKAGETLFIKQNTQLAEFRGARLQLEPPNDRCRCNQLDATIVAVNVDGRRQAVPEITIQQLRERGAVAIELEPAYRYIGFAVRCDTDGQVDLELVGKARL